MRRCFMCLILLTVLLSACQRAATPEVNPDVSIVSDATGTLTVFAAASLTEAFTEIGNKFSSANPGVLIVYNFAGSQQLAQQISQGAPADVFAAANNRQLEVVIKGGRIAEGAQQIFARNRLVVITPADNPAQVNTLADIARPGVKVDLAAQEVPVGQYSLDFLDKAAADPAYGAAYKEAVLANVVSYEENVKAVLAKVSLGEADAGIVYTSDITGPNAQQLHQIEIPDALNTIATYPIAPLSDAKEPELAVMFITYVLGAEGQAVLAKHGFGAVD